MSTEARKRAAARGQGTAGVKPSSSRPSSVNRIVRGDEADPEFAAEAAVARDDLDPESLYPRPLAERKRLTGQDALWMMLTTSKAFIAAALVSGALFILCSRQGPLVAPLPTAPYHWMIGILIPILVLTLKRSFDGALDRAGESGSMLRTGAVTAVGYSPLLFAVSVTALTFIRPATIEWRFGPAVLRVPVGYLPKGTALRKDEIELSVCWPEVNVSGWSGECEVFNRALVTISDASSVRLPEGPELRTIGTTTTFAFKVDGLVIQGEVQKRPDWEWTHVRPGLVRLVDSWRR